MAIDQYDSLRVWRAAVILAAGFAAACQGVQDPSQAGFLDGARNLLGGTYDDRVTALEQEHQALQTDNDIWREHVRELEDTRARQESEIATLDKRLSGLEGELESLHRRLRQARHSRNAGQAALTRAEAEVTQLEMQLEALAADRDRATEERAEEIQELEARSRRLQEGIEDALLLGTAN